MISNTVEASFASGGLLLEGLLDERPGQRAVVLTHPHPLYGGDMYNSVVGALAEAYGENGFTCLRMNFRGAGQSQGEYTDGPGEVQDVLAAMEFLKTRQKPALHLAGYSFGAWICAQACGLAPETPLVMVAPPVAFLDFSLVGPLPGLVFAAVGSHDGFAPVDAVTRAMAAWNPAAELEVIHGADHFFRLGLSALTQAVSRRLKSQT